jgi:hypothetical protein
VDTSGKCADCVSELDHCHGTLIQHPDGLTDCTDNQCDQLDPARHGWLITCDAIQGGCGCDQPFAPDVLATAS